MPDLAAIGMPPLSLWTAGALLALLLVLFLVAMRSSGSFGSIAALFGIPALVVIAWSAWNFSEHSILWQRGMEREALNTRALQLTAAAVAPGSPLACLDGAGDDVLGASCESAIFLKPESVAAATAYMEAKLRLLVDGLDYAHRTDRNYYNTLNQWRDAIEADRYGFVAHVLMTRYGCTADACSAFGWLLRDATAVKANIDSRRLENTVARYAASWSGRKDLPAVATADPPGAIISGAPRTKPIDFPSAASIPPVTIMTDSPPAAGPAAPEAPTGAAPAVRRPPASASGTGRAAPPPASAPTPPASAPARPR